MSLKSGASMPMLSADVMDPTDHVSGGVFDAYAPSSVPSEKIDFGMEWNIKARGNDNIFDFGKIPIAKAITNAFKSAKTLNSVEIHLVWKSYVPPTEGHDNVSISLLFTQYGGLENQQQITHVHPTHLHMHHIFYPRHSCSIKGTAILPWALAIHIEGEQYKKDYVVADAYIRLVGYAKSVASYPDDRESELISIVPMDVRIEGIRMSKPRHVGESWTSGYVKRGTSSEVNVKKMILLQKLGVDIEGATMMKVMSQLLKAIPHNALGNKPEKSVIEKVGRDVNGILHCASSNYMD